MRAHAEGGARAEAADRDLLVLRVVLPVAREDARHAHQHLGEVHPGLAGRSRIHLHHAERGGHVERRNVEPAGIDLDHRQGALNRRVGGRVLRPRHLPGQRAAEHRRDAAREPLLAGDWQGRMGLKAIWRGDSCFNASPWLRGAGNAGVVEQSSAPVGECRGGGRPGGSRFAPTSAIVRASRGQAAFFSSTRRRRRMRRSCGRYCRESPSNRSG